MTKIDFVIKKRARLEIDVTDEELEVIKAGGKLPDRIQNEVDAIDWKKNADQNYSAWDDKVNLVGYTELEQNCIEVRFLNYYAGYYQLAK